MHPAGSWVRYPKGIMTHLVLLDISRSTVPITPPVFEFISKSLWHILVWTSSKYKIMYYSFEFSGPCMKYKFVHTHTYIYYLLPFSWDLNTLGHLQRATFLCSLFLVFMKVVSGITWVVYYIQYNTYVCSVTVFWHHFMYPDTDFM